MSTRTVIGLQWWSGWYLSFWDLGEGGNQPETGQEGAVRREERASHKNNLCGSVADSTCCAGRGSSLGLSTHMEWLTTACKSSSGGSDPVYWPPRAPTCMYANTQHGNKNENKINPFCFLFFFNL